VKVVVKPISETLFAQESAIPITISTTKHENFECHSEESAFADDRRISDNSTELSTEILR
jgi:hypothetical protein